MTMHPILQKLRGGDRRSIGRANDVVSDVLADPKLFGTVFAGLLAEDPLLRMRAADVVEKITAVHPEYLRPYKSKLIRQVAAVDQQEVRWHAAQMFPRLELNGAERQRVVRILVGYLNDDSSIVKTFAMQALADIAMQAPELRPAVLPRLKKLTTTGTPAMRARGRKLLARLSRAPSRPR